MQIICTLCLVFLDWVRLINDEIWGGQFVLASPAPNSGGTRPPVPRVIYAHACDVKYVRNFVVKNY